MEGKYETLKSGHCPKYPTDRPRELSSWIPQLFITKLIEENLFRLYTVHSATFPSNGCISRFRMFSCEEVFSDLSGLILTDRSKVIPASGYTCLQEVIS
ncbi:hypothetical protein CHS0354_024877 [Potamilus streckersoni]|uniref:Uncharacterized protein n=1 Tax=Potamilus streckersoni TaxID=2493646 RepID=A0AAE0TFA4_9BIVA|nr:hypothetical protein CHS0354_024877 [Potamilus streckersoni]